MFNYKVSYKYFLVSFNTYGCRLSHQSTEVSKNVVYPPIMDMSKEGQRKHNRQLLYNTIKAYPTIEQKLHELCITQKHNLKKFLLHSFPNRYISVPFVSYITRTRIIDGVPERLASINVDRELDEIKSSLCDTIIEYYCNRWEESQSKTLKDFLIEKDAGSKLVNLLIAHCYKKLALRNDYILESTIQQKPNVRSFWWHQGFDSERNIIWEKNLCFQFLDYLPFVIRTKKPLSPIVKMNDPLCSTPDVIDYHYHPKVCGIGYDIKKSLMSVPGYWFGDPYPFPFLLVYSSSRLQKFLKNMEFYNLKKIEDSVGIMSSFGWLSSIATYQGFTPFHDVTYPFVTHGILTNGQDWNFFVYQLNTMAFHSDVDNKDRRNLFWTSEKMRLFDTIEDGQIKGVNDEVFKMLLRCLLNAPEVNENCDFQPYLGADLRGEEEATFMRMLLRKRLAGVYDHYEYLNEIPAWRRIYKLHPDAPPSPFIRLE